MFVCCGCCVLSGRSLCEELITRPEESYRMWFVAVRDLETSWMKRPWPTGGCCAERKKKRYHEWNFLLWKEGFPINLTKSNFLSHISGAMTHVLPKSTSMQVQLPAVTLISLIRYSWKRKDVLVSNQRKATQNLKAEVASKLFKYLASFTHLWKTLTNQNYKRG